VAAPHRAVSLKLNWLLQADCRPQVYALSLSFISSLNFFCLYHTYIVLCFHLLKLFSDVVSQSKRRKTSMPTSCSISSRTRLHTPTATAYSHGCEAQQSWFLDNLEVCHQHRTCLFYMLCIYPSFYFSYVCRRYLFFFYVCSHL
jgi:hypothetical protein